MAVENATLITFVENWKIYQDRLTKAIAPLTDEQLALVAAPGLRTIGQIATHMIGARVGWFTQFLGEDGGDAAPRAKWDRPGAPTHTAAELVEGLEGSWQMLTGALARWSPADMAQTFPDEDEGEHYELSRSWVIWHLLEHDLHHGGEISLTLGAHGLEAPDV
jgi:uncharacterized damage-inducible protein DinB